MNNALHNKDCPALMSDGRFATDYRPSCYVHDLIQKQNNINNSHQLRQFLQRNGTEFIKLNTQYFGDKNSCNSCQVTHVDPNGHDKYWNDYKQRLGFYDKK